MKQPNKKKSGKLDRQSLSPQKLKFWESLKFDFFRHMK
jgi:hypothetical protein